MKPLRILYFVCLILLSACNHNNNVEHKNDQTISPYLFGQNLWLTEGAEGRTGYIHEHLWPKVKASGVKMVRIGGHGYDVSLPGIDTLEMWVQAIKEIGAEPLFQVPRYDPVKKAVELVHYFNVEHNYAIKYWAIGNEPFHMGKLSIDSISNYIKTFSTAMKEVDPSIKIFVPDAAAYYKDLHQKLLLDNNKSVAGRDKNGNWYIDGIAFHNYPNSKDYTRSDVIFYSVSKMRGMIMELTRDLALANKKYERSGDNKLIWGLTEFNITYNNPDDHSVEGIAVPSFINGQFWVDVFGMAMEYDAFTVTPWCIQESDRKSSYFGYVGGPPYFTPHSTYYHMQLMSEFFKGSYVKMTTSDPYIKAFGASSDEKTTILLMNQDLNKSVNFSLNKINQTEDSEGLKISASQEMKANFSGSIEANSTLLFVFDKAGKLEKQMVYNLDLAKENKAPELIN